MLQQSGPGVGWARLRVPLRGGAPRPAPPLGLQRPGRGVHPTALSAPSALPHTASILRRARTWSSQGFHAVFPANPRLDPRLRGPGSARVSESWGPRTVGHRRSGVGWDRALGLPGQREPRAASLHPTSRPAILILWVLVRRGAAPMLGCVWEVRFAWACGVLHCVCVFCGPGDGVWCGVVEAPVLQLEVGQADTRPGCLCALWSQAHPPTRINQNPRRAPHALSDTYIPDMW